MTRSLSDVRPEAVLQRLVAMGLNARLMKGDRCVIASMRIGADPFPTLSGSVPIESVVFTTIGADRIKCLRPRALFQLPMIRVIDCRDATEIEARIRLAWQRHVQEMRESTLWLSGLGMEYELTAEKSVVRFPLMGESSRVLVSIAQGREVILPGNGPLSGRALRRPEDRTMKIDAGVDAGVDVQIAVSNRLEEIKRMEERLEDEQRHSAMRERGSAQNIRGVDTPRRAPILLVGPKLSAERSSIESMRLRGYDVLTARNQNEALAHFEEQSPELVMVDAELGRSEGLDMIPTLRHVSGVEEIPVVLVDQKRRSSRREAARRVGAAGYLVYPIDVSRIAKRLQKLVEEPSRRRFKRYSRKLSAKLNDVGNNTMVTALGRGGMFIATDANLPASSMQSCRIALPEMGENLSVDAQVIYRVGAAGSHRGGVGMRFHAFPERHEGLLIRYLSSLDQIPPAPA